LQTAHVSGKPLQVTDAVHFQPLVTVQHELDKLHAERGMRKYALLDAMSEST